ncbi:MAG TPA: hypothetical protein VH305_06560 [Gaiella sp.]|jgi:hypothetical protein
MRTALVVGVSIAWLAAAPQALAADRVVERGIVQSVTPSAVVLRALDGVEIEVPVGARTRIRVNGVPATLADVRPGFVAEAVHFGTRPAVRLRAYGRVIATTLRGRLVGVRDAWLVLRGGSGRQRVPLTAQTVVRRAGRTVAPLSLRVGMRVEVVRADDGSAQVVRILRRGR